MSVEEIIMSETVEHVPERSMYALWSNGEVKGRADYQISGNSLRVTHVEVDPSLQGQGLAALLMRELLDDTRQETNYRVVPECSYAVRYMQQHPIYQDLLTRGE